VEEKSKTQRKREVEALQAKAVAISLLPEGLFKQIPLPEDLKQAMLEYRKMKSHGAKFRQAQYLGKLMRKNDSKPIVDAFDKLSNRKKGV